MSTGPIFQFRLYIAGDGPNSVHAVANLRALCEERLSARHSIEIVDVLKDQAKALADGVLMTPLLVKLSPAPVRKIVGSLGQRESLLQALGLTALNP